VEQAVNIATGTDIGSRVRQLAPAVADMWKQGLKFKYHGNWGGPRYSAGRNTEGDEPLTAADLAVRATDHADQLMKYHDIRYARAATLPRGQRAEALREADRLLVRGLQEGLAQNKIQGFLGQQKATAAILAFKAKLAADQYSESGELRSGNLAAWRRLYDLELGLELPDEELGIERLEERAELPKSLQLSINEAEDDFGDVPVAAEIESILRPADATNVPVPEEDALRELQEINDLLQALYDGDIEN
jgi:hypothetical protein